MIGRGGRHITRGEALSHMFGATLCNEGAVRDWMRHGKFNVTQGKNFDRSGSLGPWIVTADALDLAKPFTLTTRVNGEVRQHDSTERLMFPFDYLIEYLSTFATLVPGDVIVTGNADRLRPILRSAEMAQARRRRGDRRAGHRPACATRVVDEP